MPPPEVPERRENQAKHDVAEDAEPRRNSVPRIAGKVAGHRDTGRPQRAAKEIPHQKGAVVHPRCAAEAGDERAERCREAADEDGAAAEPSDEFLGTFDMLGFENPRRDAPEQCIAEPETDRVADVVADNRTGHGRQDHPPQGQVGLKSEHSAKEHSSLTGKDESEKYGRLQGRQREDDEEREPGWNVQNVRDDVTHGEPLSRADCRVVRPIHHGAPVRGARIRKKTEADTAWFLTSTPVRCHR